MAERLSDARVPEPSLYDLLARVPEPLRERAREIRPRRLARMLEIVDRRMEGVEVVVEAVRRRHNVSAILRSSDAFGLHRVHLVTGDFTPSPGASRGSERWLDLRFHPSTASCIAELRTRGRRIWVADLMEGAVPPEEVPVDQPVAILFGSELSGVSAPARAMADGAVQIPMRGFVESLNVSTAAAILLRTLADRRFSLVGPDLSPAARYDALATWIARETEWIDAARYRNGT